MGKPVKVVGVAPRTMSKSGKQADIVFTGLGPARRWIRS